jgi:hypothetical protein
MPAWYHQKEIKPFLPDLFFDIRLQFNTDINSYGLVLKVY